MLLAMFETYYHERALHASGAGLMAESHYRLLKQRRAAQGRGQAVRSVEGGALPFRLSLGLGLGGGSVVVPPPPSVGGGGQKAGGTLWVDAEGRAAYARPPTPRQGGKRPAAAGGAARGVLG